MWKSNRCGFRRSRTKIARKIEPAKRAYYRYASRHISYMAAVLRAFVEPRVAPSWCARVDGNKRKNGSPEIVLRVSRLAPLAVFLVSIEKWWGLERLCSGPHPFLRVLWRCPTLPHPPRCSTIGACGLSFQVRNGGWAFPRGYDHHKWFNQYSLCPPRVSVSGGLCWL